jgi:heme-degrading monooxygenase HmoA
MISRVWHGWTSQENADAYQKLLRETVLPEIHRVRGFKGARVLRRAVKNGDVKNDAVKNGAAKNEVEFVVITQFDSIEDVKQFAGADYEVAVIEPAARKLLAHFDARTTLYETAVEID